MSRISALTHDAPGLYGPPDEYELDTAPYIARLLASDEFRADMCGDNQDALLAALKSGDVAPLLAVIEAEAHSRLADWIANRTDMHESEADSAEVFCRLFEKWDDIRRAKEAA
jgi:hypothetical protein